MNTFSVARTFVATAAVLISGPSFAQSCDVLHPGSAHYGGVHGEAPSIAGFSYRRVAIQPNWHEVQVSAAPPVEEVKVNATRPNYTPTPVVFVVDQVVEFVEGYDLSSGFGSTVEVQAAAQSLVGGLRVASSANVQFNGTSSVQTSFTIRYMDQATVPCCREYNFKATSWYRAASGTARYAQHRVVCQMTNSDGEVVGTIATLCGEGVLSGTSEGYQASNFGVWTYRRLEPCSACDDDDDGNGPGGGNPGGGPPGGGGGGGGGDGNCDDLEPLDILGPGTLIGGIILIGEDLLELPGFKIPCPPGGEWVVQMAPGSGVSVIVQLKFE